MEMQSFIHLARHTVSDALPFRLHAVTLSLASPVAVAGEPHTGYSHQHKHGRTVHKSLERTGVSGWQMCCSGTHPAILLPSPERPNGLLFTSHCITFLCLLKCHNLVYTPSLVLKRQRTPPKTPGCSPEEWKRSISEALPVIGQHPRTASQSPRWQQTLTLFVSSHFW